MKVAPSAFGTTSWSVAEPTEHIGETDMAIWYARYSGDESDRARVYIVEYTPDYLADHWCRRGHILSCLDDELEITLKDGHTFMLTPGTNYQVGDDTEAH